MVKDKTGCESIIRYFLLLLLSSFALLSVLSLALGILELVISDPTILFWDFRNAYYPAGKAVLSGASLSPLIEKGVQGFVNLPILAWLFVPFALLPMKVAAVIFSVIGIGAIGMALWLLADLAELKGIGRAWLLLVMAANGPISYSLKLGNTSHIILAMLAGGLWLMRRKLALYAGLILGLAALIKLPILLFGLYFILRRHFAAALGFFCVVFLFGGLSVAIYGLPLHVEWYKVAIGGFRGQALAAFNVQSLQSYMLRLFEPKPLLMDWGLQPLTLLAQRLVLFTVIAFYTIFLWSVVGRNRLTPAKSLEEKQGRDYMALIALCLITSPLSWTHYYCWLLLPAAFAVKTFVEGSRLPWLSVLAIVFVSLPVRPISIPIPFLMTLYGKIFVSIYLIGAVIWFISLTLMKTPYLAGIRTRERPITSPIIR